MLRILWLFTISMMFVIIGCESQEQTQSQTAPHQVVKPQKPLKTEEDAKPPIAAAQAVAEQAEKKVAEIAKVAEDTAEKSVQAIEEKTEEVLNKIEETTALPAAAAGKIVKDAEKAQADYPGEIVLNASYGNVTFPHGQHASDMNCETCHDGTPGAFDLDKEVAHKLCKGCHKDGGSGPTGCKDCHIK